MSVAAAMQRFRLPIGFVLAILYLLFARPRPLTLVVGAVIAFIGLLIRAWAAGHIVKTTKLTTSGPYAHTRNPLYFGSFLIAAGFAIAAHWSVLLLVITLWVLVYWPVIERERAGISGAFPDAYPDYEKNVPAFVPRVRPWRPVGVDGRLAEEQAEFDARLYMRHREWQAALGFAAALAWLVYRTWWQM